MLGLFWGCGVMCCIGVVMDKGYDGVMDRVVVLVVL